MAKLAPGVFSNRVAPGLKIPILCSDPDSDLRKCWDPDPVFLKDFRLQPKESQTPLELPSPCSIFVDIRIRIRFSLEDRMLNQPISNMVTGTSVLDIISLEMGNFRSYLRQLVSLLPSPGRMRGVKSALCLDFF